MSNTLVLFGTSLLCLYIIAVIRRLYYHPLSRYSGTRLGIAFPTWRKLYRNFRQRGQFLFEIEEMHKQYGPVVRCGVNDIHVNDPEVFLEMTRIGSRFRKDPKFYDRISFRKTSLGFLDPYAHRARHTTLVNAVFSPKKIRDLAELVEQKVAKLVERFERDSQNEFPVNIQKSIKALSMDIISELTMGQSFNCLDHPAYRNIFLEKLHAIFQEMTWIQKILFTVARVSLSSPPWMFRFVHPPTMVMMKELAKPLVRDYIDSKDGAGTESDSGRKSVIIDALVDTTKGDKKLDFDNLCEEIVTLLTAGGDTVSSALIWGIYHICREESVYHALEKELLVAFPAKSPVTYSVAKDLPYLTACIKEVLRLSNPLPGRLPRVVPPEGFDLYGRHVPGGYVINTSAYLLNRHPSIWDNPTIFDPSRWLQPNSKNLEQYMTSFYRGTRQCLGQDLAWCELYVAFASIFRHFEVAIHDTSDADMEWVDAVLIVFKGKNFHAKLAPRVA